MMMRICAVEVSVYFFAKRTLNEEEKEE